MVHAPEIETSTPEAQGMSRAPLVQLTRWLRDTPIPVFSILVSRHGKLVYELYTSFDRDDAHYLMSVTKSVLSALVGIAIERHLLPGPEAPMADALPRALFPGDADVARFRGVTLQDASGIDNGGYGLRLRPVDMQKFGLLYLRHGVWNGRQLVPEAWVARSFEPWNRSRPEAARPDYGWFWWEYDYGPGWKVHVANGWKGQRIAVIPEQDIVLTMTGCIEDDTEHALFEELVKKVLVPSVAQGAGAAAPEDPRELDALLDAVHRGPSRLGDWIEYRMVPSTAPKAKRRPFVAQR